jgi:hypothetical protein
MRERRAARGKRPAAVIASETGERLRKGEELTGGSGGQ